MAEIRKPKVVIYICTTVVLPSVASCLTLHVKGSISMSSQSNSGGGNSSRVQPGNASEEEDSDGIKDPKPREYLFEKELINKQNKHIYIVDDFVPSRSTQHLAAKFYARHEQFLPEKHITYRSFVATPEVIQHRSENHVYGWLPPSMQGKSSHLLQQLNFISAPKQRCCLTVFGEELYSEQMTARRPFNGLRFHLH